MFRIVLSFALLLAACGGSPSNSDGGTGGGSGGGTASGGGSAGGGGGGMNTGGGAGGGSPMPLVESGTATGTYGFQVGSAKALLQGSAGGAQPIAIFLHETDLGCPARVDQPPEKAGQGLLMQARNGALQVGSYSAGELYLLRGRFQPDAGVPTSVGADNLGGTLTITSTDGGLVGSYQFTNSGGTLSGQFSAPYCGPY